MQKIIGTIKQIFPARTGSKLVGKILREWRKQDIVISEYGNPSNEILIVCWNQIAGDLGVRYRIGDMVEVEFKTSSYKPKLEEDKWYTNAVALNMVHYLGTTGENNKVLLSSIENMLTNMSNIIIPAEFGEPLDPHEVTKRMFYSLKDVIKVLDMPVEYQKAIIDYTTRIDNALDIRSSIAA